MIKDISEDIVYDLTAESETSSFSLTNVAYDVSFGDNGFLALPNPQNPYSRETAPYKKDQFDNSQEPGEQTLVGWWIRTQTSWHHGAGIRYFEPGLEKNINYRFYDSRGVDVWNTGEASLLPEVFHAYTGQNGINAAPGNDGSVDCLVCGDSAGALKKVTLDGNNTANSSAYTIASHTTFPFYSVTTDGSNYYAACSIAVHSGSIASNADVIKYVHSANATDKVFIKYVKGYVLLGVGRTLYNLYDIRTATTTHNHGTSTLPGAGYTLDHINSDWKWNDATAAPAYIYASGYSKNVSEVWAIGYDEATHKPGMADAQLMVTLPYGEVVNSVHYYLGYLCLGTTKGIRICQIATDGTVILGPLLWDSNYSVNGFTEKGSYIYGATALQSSSVGNVAGLVRVDLSEPFEDGTFPYANDLEYQSDTQSEATEVYNIDDRLVMVIEEDGTGELIVEHTTSKRSSGWLETGFTRYATTEPKYFKYLNTTAEFSNEDSIGISLLDSGNNSYSLATITADNNNKDIEIHNPSGKQETLAMRFTLNNNSPVTNTPKLYNWRLKSVPAATRQKLITYVLSCYDIEQDRFNSQFGYIDRAYQLIKHMEELEKEGQFVLVQDWRTGEGYTGIIEAMRFENTASSDKNSSGYGGILTVTVRKVN